MKLPKFLEGTLQLDKQSLYKLGTRPSSTAGLVALFVADLLVIWMQFDIHSREDHWAISVIALLMSAWFLVNATSVLRDLFNKFK